MSVVQLPITSARIVDGTITTDDLAAVLSNELHVQDTDTKLDEGGANEVTAAQAKAASTHATGDGSDHSDVATNSAHVSGDGSDHADVATNTVHVAGDGSDHADVATNTVHSSGDGSDHADVASNTTHRGVTTGNPHSVSKSDVGLGNVANIAQIFEDNSGVIRQRSGYDDDFVFGSPQLDDDGTAAHDGRMFFDKSKGAFFAGMQTGTNADNANRGNYSANFGYNGTASGSYSTHFGVIGTASGYYSTHFGVIGTASGYYSTHFGYGGTADGYYSAHFGSGGDASGNNSTHFGRYGIADKWGQITHGGGRFTTDGDAQLSTFVLRATTIDATSVQMYLNNSSSTKLTIPTDTAWAFDIHVIAAEQGMANIKEFERKGCIVNDGGTVSISTVDTLATDRTVGSPGAWDVTVQADDTNNTLDINITGEAATNIRWVAEVRVVEVSYPAA